MTNSAVAKPTPGRVVLDLTVTPELPLDAPQFIATAQQLEVADQESYEIAVQMCQRQAQWESVVDNSRLGEVRESAHKTWKMVLGLMDDCKAAMRVRPILDPKVKRYLEQKEREKQAEEQRLRREQDERDRLAREEADRLRREAEAEAARKRSAGEIRQAREVVATAEQIAEAIILDAENELPANLPATTQRIAGFSTPRPWVAEITDLRALLHSIADNPRLFPDKELERFWESVREAAQTLLTKRAKQVQQIELGVNGAKGKRDIGTRYNKAPTVLPEEDWKW